MARRRPKMTPEEMARRLRAEKIDAAFKRRFGPSVTRELTTEAAEWQRERTRRNTKPSYAKHSTLQIGCTRGFWHNGLRVATRPTWLRSERVIRSCIRPICFRTILC